MSDHQHRILDPKIGQSTELFCEFRIDRNGWGHFTMGTGHLRGKAAEYLRLARNLSLHSPTRRHLIVMAERLERQAKEIEDAAAPGRQDEADNSESDDPEA